MTATLPDLRLLVVEDERPLADAVRRYFQHRGHKVRVAHDADEAVRAHRDAPVDIALIDLVLENSDGMQVLRELLHDQRPPECLIVTGRGSIEGAVEAMRIGAFDYVPKPFEFEDLDERVRSARAHRERRTTPATPPGGAASSDHPAPIALGDVERDHIASVLAHTNWHQGRAAAILGISVRTLYRKIREYGFRRPTPPRG